MCIFYSQKLNDVLCRLNSKVGGSFYLFFHPNSRLAGGILFIIQITREIIVFEDREKFEAGITTDWGSL